MQREFEIARSVSEAALHRELFLGHPHHGKLKQTLPQARLHERPAHLQQMHAHLNARLCAGSLEYHIATVTEFVLFHQSCRRNFRTILLVRHKRPHAIHEPPRKLKLPLQNIHHNHPRRSKRLGDRRAKESNRPAPHHHHALPAPHIRQPIRMHRHRQRLDQHGFVQPHALAQLVAEILGDAEVLAQRPVRRDLLDARGNSARRRREPHALAQVVPALLARAAAAARVARLDGHGVAGRERRHGGPDGGDGAGGLVAHDDGGFGRDLARHAAVVPEVHVGAAAADVGDADEDVMRGGGLRDGARQEAGVVGVVEEEGEVLREGGVNGLCLSSSDNFFFSSLRSWGLGIFGQLVRLVKHSDLNVHTFSSSAGQALSLLMVAVIGWSGGGGGGDDNVRDRRP